jgi:hypothetical protein
MMKMADRYQSDDRSRRYGARRGSGRQAEQFQSDYDDERRDQMGDSWRDDEFGAQQAGWQADDRFDRERGRDFSGSRSDRFGEERFERGAYGSGRYTPGGERSYSSFTGSDFGGGDFSRGTGGYGQERWPSSGDRGYGRSAYGARSGSPGGYGAGSWLGANHGEWRERNFTSDRGYGRGEGDERGFFERAGEAIGRWFGDDDGSGRQRESYRGHGPAGYTRTDERIREDASERLTDDWAVDARKIELTVSSGEITLNGTVPSRDQKRRAEDLVENLSGVKHVQNNLRVEQGSTWDRNNSGETSGSSANKTTTAR